MQIINNKKFSSEIGLLMFKSVYKDDEQLIETVQSLLNYIDTVDESTLKGIKDEATSYALNDKQIKVYIEIIENTFGVTFCS